MVRVQDAPKIETPITLGWDGALVKRIQEEVPRYKGKVGKHVVNMLNKLERGDVLNISIQHGQTEGTILVAVQAYAKMRDEQDAETTPAAQPPLLPPVPQHNTAFEDARPAQRRSRGMMKD